MKKLVCLIITCLIFSVVGPIKAQNIDNQAIHMLNEFYTTYSKIKFSVQNIQKLDSLQKKYCSVKQIKELKEEFKANGLDHDLLTNDHGIDGEAFKTLTIFKDKNNVNTYIVSYLHKTINASNKPIIEKVVLHVSVIKEKGTVKISSVR